ncbi:MAG TPA: GtrA family protein [Anaerolineales bacterium]
MAVGAIGAVVDFGIFNLLRGLLRVVSPVSQAVSFSAAVTSNFLWNRLWTYPDSRSKPLRRQALQFVLVNLVGLGIRTPIFVLVEPGMQRAAVGVLSAGRESLPAAVHPLFPAASLLGSNLALGVAVVVVLFWNFAVNRLWTYSDAP